MLNDANGTLHDRVDEFDSYVRLERRAKERMRRDRDFVRYAAVRAGLPDPLPSPAREHLSLWTGGHPYLTGQHITYAGCCYQASDGGVPAGLRPDRSHLWHRCGPDADCPVPLMLPPVEHEHPLSSGLAVRQTDYWWDREGEAWSIRESSDPERPSLSREHLLAVLDHLSRELVLTVVWSQEFERDRLLVPCPPNAYFDELASAESGDTGSAAVAWRDDTPIWRALLAEKRRRRIRHRPGRHIVR